MYPKTDDELNEQMRLWCTPTTIHAESGKADDMKTVNQAAFDFMRKIAKHVPACADRTVAFRRIREARMIANQAIVLEGN